MVEDFIISHAGIYCSCLCLPQSLPETSAIKDYLKGSGNTRGMLHIYLNSQSVKTRSACFLDWCSSVYL